MNNTVTSYNITEAENGWIVGKTTDTETQKDDSFSSTYTSETYVFQKWDEVLEFLKGNDKA